MKTTVIMSNEEAMALPLKDRPICYRISSEIYIAIFEHIGEASMAWNPKPSNEVFNSEMASDVAVRLCFKVAEEVEKQKLDALKQGMTLAAEIVHSNIKPAWGIQDDYFNYQQGIRVDLKKYILIARDNKKEL